MLKEKVCTAFELKQFSFSSLNENILVFDLAKFIECKSAFKYTVLEIKFISDTFKTLESYIQLSSKLKQGFEKKWNDSNLPMNKEIQDEIRKRL